VVDLSEMSLEELLDIDVVVTATKTAQSQAAAPAVISVLTREDILRRGYQSLAEALRHVIGFYVVDDHVIPNAGVRGVAGGLFGESGTHQGDD
jgi:iron complex outermembrane receptor protein